MEDNFFHPKYWCEVAAGGCAGYYPRKISTNRFFPYITLIAALHPRASRACEEMCALFIPGGGSRRLEEFLQKEGNTPQPAKGVPHLLGHKIWGLEFVGGVVFARQPKGLVVSNLWKKNSPFLFRPYQIYFPPFLRRISFL